MNEVCLHGFRVNPPTDSMCYSSSLLVKPYVSIVHIPCLPCLASCCWTFVTFVLRTCLGISYAVMFFPYATPYLYITMIDFIWDGDWDFKLGLGLEWEQRTIRAGRYAHQDVCVTPHARVGQDSLEVAPARLVVFFVPEAPALLDENLQIQVANLFVVEPPVRKLGRVDQEKEAHDTQDHGQDALEDEDPLPSAVTTHAVHLSNPSGQEPRECTGQRACTIEDGNAGGQLLGHVPESAEVDGARVEACLKNTEQHPHNHEAGKVLDKAMACHDDAPRRHQDTDVDRRPGKPLQQDVAGDLEQDVWNKEERKRNVVLHAGQAQVLIHAFNLGIANVGAVELGDEVQDAQHRH